MAFFFINADLEITSKEDLEPIRVAFARYGHRFAEMHCGEVEPGCYLASFEVYLYEDRDDHTAEEKIHAFCDSIVELQGKARELWDAATKRVIDLGYQADDNCKTFKDRLSADVMQRMVSLNIDVAITIYPQTIR